MYIMFESKVHSERWWNIRREYSHFMKENPVLYRDKYQVLNHNIWSLLQTCIHVYPPPPVALRPKAGHGLLILKISRSHTRTHHRRYDFFGRVISASQRPLSDNTQHSQRTDIDAPGGIRTHNLSRRAAVDLRLDRAATGTNTRIYYKIY